jgi:hypothetical protein
MPTTAAYITYENTDNPNGYNPSWIADVILDPPQEMPSPWVTVTFQEYLILIEQQKQDINQAADETTYAKERASEIQKAFDLAWAYIFAEWDIAGLIQLVAWLFDPSVPQDAKDFIFAVNKWKDAVMYEYLMVKKLSILYGYPYDFDYSFIGPTPCKFTDIFLKCRPEFVPQGYQFPDVTDYTPGTRENPWQG